MHLEYSLHPLSFYTIHPLRNEFFMGITKTKGTLVYSVPKEYELEFQESIKQTIMDTLSDEDKATIEFYYERVILYDFKQDDSLTIDEMMERIELFISNNVI